MNKRLIVAYSIFSVIVFSFLIVWFVFRAINTRSGNIDDAQVELESIKKTIASSYLTDGTFSSEHFASQMKELVAESETLRAIVIYSDDSTVEYIYSSAASYINVTDETWSAGTTPPRFAYSKIQDVIIDSPVVIPTATGVQVEALFRIFSRSDIFPVIRELLIGLLSFLLVTAVMILISPHLKRLNPSFPGGEEHGDMGEEDGSLRAPSMPNSVDLGSTGPIEQRSDVSEPDISPDVHGADTGNANGLYSPTTHLGWETYLIERLSTELKRAASFDQDLVLLLCNILGATKEGKTFAEVSEIALEFFNFRDLCFEYGNSGFGIIIPNIDLDQGIDRVETFLSKTNAVLANAKRDIRLIAGLSARNGRLLSGDRIFREAEGALVKARDEQTGIVAFRVDPQKYRRYISTKTVNS